MSTTKPKNIVALATALLAASLLPGAGCGRAPRPEQGGEQGAPERHGAQAEHQEHDGEEHDGEEHDGEEHEGEGEAEHEEGVVELTPEAAARAGIKLAAVSRRVVLPVLETTGQVTYDADALIHVSPRISGRALRVLARLGDRVEKGRLLAVLDSIELGQAKAAYLRAKAKHELARRTHDRERELRADRISSQREVQAAEAEFLEAAADLASAAQTLHLYGVAPGELERLSFEDPAASHFAVRSPLAGTVVEKHVTVGELVTPEENLFTVADLSEVWITIDVYERDLAHVHLGDGVEVRVEAYPEDVFGGKVSYVGDRIDPATRALGARVDVENRDGKLHPGAFARVRLTDPHARDEPGSPHEGTAVPETSLQRSGSATVVFVPLGGNRYRETPVEVGPRGEGFARIVKGLDPGQEVVVEGAFLLRSEAARSELGGGHSH